ncbi:hypothetical protein CW676_12130 [Macrococcoides caseolyticum]|uniref:Uncharacterized protein n=1 Tax=Macrococcus psychrotolerans TaxID=3039389 RepID=A0AAT9PAM9_9STAP|nr:MULTISPECIES: hypothetical protein [Macrococcus]PKE05745.1 hypothetical protein CW692_11840 [Macrococcus caseolyticus]PKE51831.1 hypothetical protein CW676_12130 [Macrococcus caseolyticus]PKF37436.1 hypothetical protein CW681_12115 [Macrococcus caseolyticus]QYA34040.1 hypothetical protein KYI10_11610 [Macrococcus sp. 19Msa1099]QYA38824.1 hypothetical protein KYI07_11495 [Macrococcus caseolyticus]
MKKFSLILTCFALIISFVALPVNAQVVNSPSQQEIDKAASMLKFIYEEASTKDQYGNIIDMDVNKISAKYGNSQELDLFKIEI